jgi:hypothetical protein
MMGRAAAAPGWPVANDLAETWEHDIGWEVCWFDGRIWDAVVVVGWEAGPPLIGFGWVLARSQVPAPSLLLACALVIVNHQVLAGAASLLQQQRVWFRRVQDLCVSLDTRPGAWASPLFAVCPDRPLRVSKN